MRSLVGAVVGLVVATVVVAVLHSLLGQRAFLASLIAGVAAGLIMRSLAMGSGSPYLRGGLAALMTGVAAFAGPSAAAAWYRAQTLAVAAPPNLAESSIDDSDEAKASGEGAAPVEITPVADKPFAGGLSSGATLRGSGKGDNMAAEMISMAIGCLLAYQLGKGAAAAPASDESSEGEEAAADPGEADEPQEEPSET